MPEKMRYDPKKARHIFEHKKAKTLGSKEHEAMARDMANIIIRHEGLDKHDSIEHRSISDIEEAGGKEIIRYHVALCRGPLFPVAHMHFSLSPDGELKVTHMDDFSGNKEVIKAIDEGNELLGIMNDEELSMPKREKAAEKMDAVFRRFRKLTGDDEQTH